ncbi:MAG TPA: hypothetical protein VFL54_09930 [Gammaproteobacteria bacterium]|nr:hypothetical protein [Gammaproteobacteria bacterium]
MTPSSQKAGERPIGFTLYDAEKARIVSHMNLVIRPEDLTRDEPSRLSAHQTLGGAWADDFGEGLTSIEITGHTGWRGSKDRDGAAIFHALHEDIFKQWHKRRRERSDNGGDPDTIEMIFDDDLNGHSDVVVPRQFKLLRHKSRPLLKQYRISMVKLRDTADAAAELADPITDAIVNPYGRYAAASIGLKTNTAKQLALADGVNAALGDIQGISDAILTTSTGMLQAVLDVGSQAAGVFDAVTSPLLYTTLQVQKACRNAFWMLATPYGVTQNAVYTLMQMSSTFNEAYCTLLNGFNILRQFPDIEDIFGASNCSSTGGGRPLSPFQADNPFLTMFKSEKSPVSLDAGAVESLAALNQDVLSVQNYSVIPGHLAAIASGVRLT